MVIFQSNGGKFTATFQGDYKANLACYAFTRSRSMLRVKREDEETVTRVAIYTSQTSSTTPRVYYYTDPTGAVDIPLHNLVNQLYGNVSVLLHVEMYPLGSSGQLDYLTFVLDIQEGVSYNEMMAPRNKDFDGTLYAFSLACILPPNIMLNPATAGGVTGKGLIVESNYHVLDLDAHWWQQSSGVWAGITPLGQRQNQIDVAPGADILRIVTGENSDVVKEYPLTKTDYCSDLVCIRWTSLTGATRQHYFPIVAFVKGNGEQVPLVSPGDGYEVSKSNYQAVKCRLTGLTAYGYWYYMDMIQASDLHAVVYPTASNFETEMASAQTAALVDADSMETPTGNGFFNFEFTVNMRQYGKV